MKALPPLSKSSGLVRSAAFLVLACTLSASAAPTETNHIDPLSSSWTAPELTAISNTDLLESGSSSFSSLTANNPANASIPGISTQNSGLNDGLNIGSNVGHNDYPASAYYAYNIAGASQKGSLIVGDELGGGGEVLTFNLNLTNSQFGYTINSINTIAGWTDHASVANQNYTVQYSLVGSAGTFITLGTVAYNPNDPTADNPGGGGVATEVSLTNFDITHVADLRFTFTPDPSSTGDGPSATGIWLQEVDAFGIATAPEPSTWAMMLLGLAGLAFAAYRRRVIA